MKNTKANRTKFLQGYLKILLSWKDKNPNEQAMKRALEELNQSLPKQRKIKLSTGINDLWNDLWNDLRNDLRNDIGNNIGNDLRNDLGNDLRNDLGNDIGNVTWEYYEFIWPVFIGYFYKNLPIIKKRIKTIQALDKCIKAGIGYLWLSDTTLYAIPFPKISIDEQKRLHNEREYACQWSVKKQSWWIHGVKVTKKIVETPEKLTKKDWLDEKNLEIRRIIQDRMPDFARKLGAKSIQKDSFGELLEIDLKDDPEKVARYVKVKDSSTSRIYYLRVPPITKTAKEGIAWSFGLDEKTYMPEKET